MLHLALTPIGITVVFPPSNLSTLVVIVLLGIAMINTNTPPKNERSLSVDMWNRDNFVKTVGNCLPVTFSIGY